MWPRGAAGIRSPFLGLVEVDVEEIAGVGDTFGGRLGTGGIESLADLAVADPGRVADTANVSDGRDEGWIEAALEVARAVAGEGDGGEE